MKAVFLWLIVHHPSIASPTEHALKDWFSDLYHQYLAKNTLAYPVNGIDG